MSWIPANKISKNYWYADSFQKMLYYIYKDCDFEKQKINPLIGLHTKAYYKLLSGDIGLDYYFDVCWRIVDKVNEWNKGMYNREVCKEKIKNMYGFLVNRKKEEGLYDK